MGKNAREGARGSSILSMRREVCTHREMADELRSTVRRIRNTGNLL